MMDKHRIVAPAKLSSIEFYQVIRPFSFFKFMDKEYRTESIRRLCAIARTRDVKTVVVESIPPDGLIQSDNDEMQLLFRGFEMAGLRRMSFWKVSLKSPKDLTRVADSAMIGYAILKSDQIPGGKTHTKEAGSWYVFESVMAKNPLQHYHVPKQHTYNVNVAGNEFSIKGVLYCQQNGLNKSCGHVALRTMLTRLLPDGDIEYSRINELAGKTKGKRFNPKSGLNIQQIRSVLEGLNINFRDVVYSTYLDNDENIPKGLDYQRYLYQGIESGAGAMLGFCFTKSHTKQTRHIIPFFGHTFNKDTWVPDAEKSYFRLKDHIGYIPSEMWTGNYIGHDDNFGPNFCIPRHYLQPAQVDYVLQFLPNGAQFTGNEAEVMALDYLYALFPESPVHNVLWLHRLKGWADDPASCVILRAVYMEKPTFIKNLKEAQDWDGNKEQTSIIDIFNDSLPQYIWDVEVSIPHLFPATQRKLGDIIFNAGEKLNLENHKPVKQFIMARLPGFYFFEKESEDSTIKFNNIQSKLKSHIPVF